MFRGVTIAEKRVIYRRTVLKNAEMMEKVSRVCTVEKIRRARRKEKEKESEKEANLAQNHRRNLEAKKEKARRIEMVADLKSAGLG